jgi:hypothetical protein
LGAYFVVYCYFSIIGSIVIGYKINSWYLKDHLEEVGIDEKILNWILKKWGQGY